MWYTSEDFGLKSPAISGNHFSQKTVHLYRSTGRVELENKNVIIKKTC